MSDGFNKIVERRNPTRNANQPIVAARRAAHPNSRWAVNNTDDTQQHFKILSALLLATF